MNEFDRQNPQDDRRADDATPLPEHLTLNEILEFIWKYRVSIAVVSILPVIAALFYVVTTSPVYTARAQLLLDPRTPQPLRSDGDNSAANFDSPYIESQIAVIRSEEIALAVAKQLGLNRDPEFLGRFASDVVAEGGGAKNGFERTREVIDSFERRLDVRRVGLSYAIDVNFSSQDPEKAARVANSVADAFVRDQLETRSEALRAGSQWLEQRLDLLRDKMNSAALKVQRFKAKRDYRILDRVGGESEKESEGQESKVQPRDTLEELESTALTFRRIYESYLQAYTESLQRQSFPITNVRVITPATRPLAPSAPKKKLIVAFALLVGLLLALGQALFRFHQL